MHRHAPVRVVIIEGDVLDRRGMAATLTETGLVRLAGTMAPGDVPADGTWHGVDIVLVRVEDQHVGIDRLSGIPVMERIRRSPTSSRVTVIAVTAHIHSDAVRRRVREAGADCLYARDELGVDGGLLAAVRARRPVPPPRDPEAMYRLGITQRTRVNRAVSYALCQGLFELLTVRADPGRRALIRIRREFNAEARLTAVTSDGRLPDRQQELPSVRQIARFLSWATMPQSEPDVGDECDYDAGPVELEARAVR